MATYNGSEHIEEQLQSLASQTHANWELIVSDDGSTDQTREIVHHFAQAVSQKVTIIKGPQQGFWKNFLWLVSQTGQAQGDLFAYCDQDDVWLPEKLERATNWFEKAGQERPGLYFARTELIDEVGKPIGFSPLFCRPPSFQNALVQNIGGGNTMVMNRPARALLAQTPKTVSLIAHDWWTYQLVTAAGGSAFYDPLPAVRYRQHSQNLIGSNRGIRQRMTRTMAFGSGRWRGWNDVSLTALGAIRGLFTPSALATLDDFALARRSKLADRMRLLWRSGVYRQNATETIAIYVGAIFGRI
ncbi:glycosyltransferase family 2 protein [Bradyrhizobium sp. CCGUVB1N3]|uniref:glycosyltransferase family 2 protein n=1 Tax=Bradyrhizobium sp. CCGUVB1N3 TaxID=2949629 RepID=UPI0020B37BE9|nr:glycosyltransferase family 2 protein [Bradyrhizobium sp. CCGUVB1N3]MCP3477064.1 glycosyltransferase family 2 protein [Bradyrhizobium sp. CCGUVB1N3]